MVSLTVGYGCMHSVVSSQNRNNTIWIPPPLPNYIILFSETRYQRDCPALKCPALNGSKHEGAASYTKLCYFE